VTKAFRPYRKACASCKVARRHTENEARMKVLICHGPRASAWQEMPGRMLAADAG